MLLHTYTWLWNKTLWLAVLRMGFFLAKDELQQV